MPQLSEGRTNSSLGGLASLAGINLSAIMGGQPQDIAPSLYPQIAESVPYRRALLDAKVESNTTFRDYTPSGQMPFIKKYNPSFSGLLLNKQNDNNKNLNTTLFQITKKDKYLFEFLEKVVSIEVDDQEGLVSISVELADRSRSCTTGASCYRIVAE